MGPATDALRSKHIKPETFGLINDDRLDKRFIGDDAFWGVYTIENSQDLEHDFPDDRSTNVEGHSF